ncbi:MAG: elongation factor G [Anaerolineales bacterium]|nr:elongation factor G [Anaerolineales bacterium]
MKEYSTDKIRNIALVSHSSAGKTMLAEAYLHTTGVTTRLGRIEDGTTASDFEDEEIRRGISLSTSVLPIEHKDHKINFLDTPGYTDFVGEVISSLRVADGAIVVVDSVAGAEVGTEIGWNFADEFNLPRFVVINKMDRDNANFQKALGTVADSFETRLIPVQLPWGEKAEFKGVLDLLSMKAYAGAGKDGEEIPAEFSDAVEEARMELVEAAAEGDDELLMKYLDGDELSPVEIAAGLRSAILSGEVVPVFVTAATSEIGMYPLADAIISMMPSPADRPAVEAEGASATEELLASDAGPLAAYVWKTTADPFVGKITYFKIYSGVINSDGRVWNQNAREAERLGGIFVIRGKEQISVKVLHSGDIGVVAKLGETSTSHTFSDKAHALTMPVPDYPNALFQVAVSPATQADSAKVSPTLTRLCEEDMTLSWRQEPSTKQTILQGMGDQHIDVAIRKAESKFQTILNTEIPKVPYQETITKAGSAQYRHKKQSGGSGQFGEVHLRVEPLPDEDFEFKNEVFGGAVSQNYMPAIEKGVKNVMLDGVIAGYPVHNVKVAVFDGKEHPVDSKPMAFEIAARECFKLAVMQASPVMLEPIMSVQVTVPEASMGDILGDLNTRRSRVQGMDTVRGKSVINANVPLAEMQRYTTDLRSMTGGRGVFAMEFDHYETLPSHLAEEIIQSAQQEKEEK